MHLALLAFALTGCTAGGGKTDTMSTDTSVDTSETGDTSDDTSDTNETAETGDTDTGTEPECNTDNEDCHPGSCGGEGASMLPGSDCTQCHKSGGGEAPAWSVAGTVFSDIYGSSGANKVTIRVTDKNGKTAELTSNSVGNFYSSQNLSAPFDAEIEVGGVVTKMGGKATSGGCDSCHKCDGEAGGKLYTP